MSEEEVSHISQSSLIYGKKRPCNVFSGVVLSPLWKCKLNTFGFYMMPENIHMYKKKTQKGKTEKIYKLQTYTNIKKTLVQSCRDTKISIKMTKCVITLCLRQKQRWGAHRLCWVTPSCPQSAHLYLWLFVPSWFDQYLRPYTTKSQIPELWQRRID